jgi:hypothetical protein
MKLGPLLGPLVAHTVEYNVYNVFMLQFVMYSTYSGICNCISTCLHSANKLIINFYYINILADMVNFLICFYFIM